MDINLSKEARAEWEIKMHSYGSSLDKREVKRNSSNSLNVYMIMESPVLETT